VGEHKDGIINGQGTYYFLANNKFKGDKYVGDYTDGKFYGQGTYTFANGDKYVGEFMDGQSNGQGTYTFANGAKYVGEYKDGKYNGRGTYTWANGNKDIGEFKDGKLNGRAIKYNANGSIKESGIYQDDVLVTTVETSTSIVPGTVFQDCDECPEMVVLPAGQYLMGAYPGEEERENLPKDFRDRSKPQHRVNVGRFAAGKFSVTREQYQAFVKATRRKHDGCFVWTGDKWEHDLTKDWRFPRFQQDGLHPVTCVSWDDASAYVQWLSQKTGKDYRLLTEAEWEYAARAGTRTYRYWGDDGNMSCGYANGGDQTAKAQVPGAGNWTLATCNDGFAYTAPVGSFQPNNFGLYDTLGNVYQWTQDCLNHNYIGAPTDGRSWINGECSKRVLRGGSWSSIPQFISAAFRFDLIAASRFNNVGFRVAVEIPSDAKDLSQQQIKRLKRIDTSPSGIGDSANESKVAGSPSNSYLGRLRARVKPNIVFSDSDLQSVQGNPAADVDVSCSPSGLITGIRLTKSSGNEAWDQAVLKAMEKTASLPRDEDGKIPQKIVFTFRPRD
jgi:TonB family protein